MVATISPSHRHYQHSINTLKYANRAKEIKTLVQKNFATLDTPVSDYQRIINSLQTEVCCLKKQLAEKESLLKVDPVENSADVELSWLNIISREISENVQERINLQKAVLELEETNLHNRLELRRLDEEISRQQAIEMEGVVVKNLRERRQIILDNIRDNDEVGADYQKEIEANEKQRCQLQDMIAEAIKNNGNTTYLQILSQYRLLVMANSELQFEIAMRDQVIHDQREDHHNLCNLLLGLKLDQELLLEYAAKEGLPTDDRITSTQRYTCSSSSYTGQLDTEQLCITKSKLHIRSSMPEPRTNWISDYSFCKERQQYDHLFPSHSRIRPRHGFSSDRRSELSFRDHRRLHVPINLKESSPVTEGSHLPFTANTLQEQLEKGI